MTVEQAWERDKHVVGKQVHDAWMATKLSHGFADHPFQGAFIADPRNEDYLIWRCARCLETLAEALPEQRHHSDMKPYAELLPEVQAYDYETGKVAYYVGWQAALEQEAA